MALLLCFNSLPSLPSSSLRIQSSPLPSPSPVCRLHVGRRANAASWRIIVSLGANWGTNHLERVSASVAVKAAASDVDGTGTESNEEPKAVVPVEELPLQSQSQSKSKEQQMMEQRMKMKLAKKIRLRRKRLVRKRKMRKKGRWPPSKMKKLKNV